MTKTHIVALVVGAVAGYFLLNTVKTWPVYSTALSYVPAA